MPEDVVYAWDIHQQRSVVICSDPSCIEEFNRKMRKITKEKSRQHGNVDS